MTMYSVYRWLWRMVPGNPMVVRIVQGGSVRLRDFWIRMGYLGSLIALVLIGLLVGGGFGGPMDLTELAKAGTRVFSLVARGQVVLVCLLAPLFMVGAIAQEQAGKTYDILLTTPLSNLQIVLGSLVGRLFFVLALLASGVPLFSVLLIFGGVPIRSVFVAFSVAALTAVFVGSVAVLLSVMRACGRKAVFMFVILIAAYLVGAYLLDTTILRQLMPIENSVTWLTPLHPLLVLEASLNTANYSPPAPELLAGYSFPIRFYLGRPFMMFSILSIVSSFVMVAWCAIVLRSIGQGQGRWMSWLATVLRLRGAAGIERSRTPRSVWHNPIAWRESHTRGKIAGGILARWGFTALALGVSSLLLGAYHMEVLPEIINRETGRPYASHEVFHQALSALLLIEVAVIILIALYMSAGSVSKEREDGTLDLMLTTPITPRQYVWGKLRGLVSFLGLLITMPVLTIAMVSVYALIGPGLGWPEATFTHRSVASGGAAIIRPGVPLMLPEAPLLMAMMLVPFVALCVAAGMNWSLKAKGVLSAVIPSVAIMGGLVLILGMCGWPLSGSVVLFGPVVNAFSPGTNLFMLVDPWDHVKDFPEHVGFGRVSLGVASLCAAVGYGLVVYALVVGMVRGFDQTVRRLSGTG